MFYLCKDNFIWFYWLIHEVLSDYYDFEILILFLICFYYWLLLKQRALKSCLKWHTTLITLELFKANCVRKGGTHHSHWQHATQTIFQAFSNCLQSHAILKFSHNTNTSKLCEWNVQPQNKHSNHILQTQFFKSVKIMLRSC